MSMGAATPCLGGSAAAVRHCFFYSSFRGIAAAVLLLILAVAIVGVVDAGDWPAPGSRCFVVTHDNTLRDFTEQIGREYQYADEAGLTFTLKFCKSVLVRSHKEIVSFGAYSRFLPVTPGVFRQEYTDGDVSQCEDFVPQALGRDAKVHVLCGGCPNGTSCGNSKTTNCICSAKLTSGNCSAEITVAATCPQRGRRVDPNFSIGLTPGGREVVDSGVPNWAFHPDSNLYTKYSFAPDHRRVYLYMSSDSLNPPTTLPAQFVVDPALALDVQLFGSGSSGGVATTTHPLILEVHWQCRKWTATAVAVNVTVPIMAQGERAYTEVAFILGKECDRAQSNESRCRVSGWERFGILALVGIVITLTLCCFGFGLNVYAHDKHGLDALPCLGTISMCLETLSGAGPGYRDYSRAHISRLPHPDISAPPYQTMANSYTRSNSKRGKRKEPNQQQQVAAPPAAPDIATTSSGVTYGTV
eukprot:jgi/Chlat1/3920/Chrsp26S04187